MINPMSLDGRNIIITGAAQGIGKGIAELAYQLGARLTLIDMNDAALRGVASQFDKDRVLTLAGSVADIAFVGDAITQSAERFGAIHGLVNNAGITRPAMIQKMTPQQWQDVMDVNLSGPYYCLQAVGQNLIARAKAGEETKGSLINISSDAGRRGTIGQVNYSVAKAGLLGMTMSAALEWARYGVRVNTVCFGVVETSMTETIRGEKFRDIYLAKIPMARWAKPDEVAKPVCFLLSDAASYITGQHLSVNGGGYMTP